MSDSSHLPSSEERPAAVDWEAIHRRVAEMQETLERWTEPPPEEKRAILRERARALALETQEEVESPDAFDVLLFGLAQESYGVEVSFIREVYPLRELTALPGVPPFVLGIMNLRGRILSVLDIKAFFGLPDRGLTELNKVIVLHRDTMEFGILADTILGVRRLSPEALQPVPGAFTGIRKEYVRGVTVDRVAVLDAATLLSGRLTLYQEVEGS